MRRAMIAACVLMAVAAGPATVPTAAPAGDGVLTAQFVKIEDSQVGKRLTIRLTNVSGKPIEAIKGSVTFLDRFGDKISNVGAAVEIDSAIAVGASVEESGVWPLDRRAENLLKTDPKNITLRWKTSKVAYAE